MNDGMNELRCTIREATKALRANKDELYKNLEDVRSFSSDISRVSKVVKQFLEGSTSGAEDYELMKCVDDYFDELLFMNNMMAASIRGLIAANEKFENQVSDKI